jgi:hypothetical protein
MKRIDEMLGGIVPERATVDGDATALAWGDVRVENDGGVAKWTHGKCDACNDYERDVSTGAACGCARVRRVAWRLTLARIPYALAHHGPDYCSEGARKWVDAWADGSRGVRMVGNPGSYKTSRACASVQRLVHRAVSARYVHWNQWLTRYRDAMGRPIDQHTIRARIVDPQVVWLDDLGCEYATDWTREQLALVVQERLDARRTICLTTNLEDDALADYLGDRLWSRIRGATAYSYVVGTDGRQA